MVRRKIITIDESRCDGCGLCVEACHEGAIALIDGKAKLVREDYCDGLGDCLPACPQNAITIEEREAATYDKATPPPLACGCPGTNAKAIERSPAKPAAAPTASAPSQLAQWPVQIKLVPVNAPYFAGAHLLIAADCTAFAYADFHSLMQGKITLIGCPKLDSVDYSEKLGAIIAKNEIESITVARMEVPCCGGLVAAVNKAVELSNKALPISTVIVGIEGNMRKS